MKDEQKELLAEIRNGAETTTQLSIEYWKEFSSFNDLQFWLVLLMLVIPLVVLFLKIDRSKMLLLGFYGLNYHVWFAYTNFAGIKLGLWEYPYAILPILPSFALDASLVPVAYMLLYQWTLNHRKNFYIYSTILSGVFAFIMKPYLVIFDFFEMYKGVNFLHLFIFYIAFFVVSKLVTNLFVKLQEKK
jgi:hypothetical protein